MAKINLLPPDLGPNASVLKLINAGKKVAVLIAITFFIFGTLLVGYIVFLKIEIQAVAKRSDTYKTSITSFKETEQGIYLLKERITKIKSLTASKAGGETMSLPQGTALNYPGITLKKVQTMPDKLVISGESKSTGVITGFFETLLVNPLYKDVKLLSFNYSQQTGYSFSLELKQK